MEGPTVSFSAFDEDGGGAETNSSFSMSRARGILLDDYVSYSGRGVLVSARLLLRSPLPRSDPFQQSTLLPSYPATPPSTS